MNWQLAAVILIVILYPVGFWLTKTNRSLAFGVPVLLLFLASLVYLLVTSWITFLMVLGSGVLFLIGSAGFDVAVKARKVLRRVPGLMLLIDFVAVGGGILLLILSVSRSLG